MSSRYNSHFYINYHDLYDLCIKKDFYEIFGRLKERSV
jgi:hypothetical protein